MPSKAVSSDDFDRLYVKPRPGRTLIIGSYVNPGRADRRLKYMDAMGVDIRPGTGVDRVEDLSNRGAMFECYGQFNHIDCISVLEHTDKPWEMAHNIEYLLTTNGTLFVASPFAWRVHNYPADYWRFTVEGIRALFPAIAWQTMLYASARGFFEHEGKIPSVKVDGHPYFARAEVCAFGEKR